MTNEAGIVRPRVEIIVGLLIGLAHGREIFEIVQDAEDAVAALANLRRKRFTIPDEVRAVFGDVSGDQCLTEKQAQSILNNRLNRFTRRERRELLEELRHLVVTMEKGCRS